MVSTNGMDRFTKGDEVTGDEMSALMNQLIERMLSIGSRFSPVDRTGIGIDWMTFECHLFAVALHR